jgi:hypothetical protein
MPLDASRSHSREPRIIASAMITHHTQRGIPRPATAMIWPSPLVDDLQLTRERSAPFPTRAARGVRFDRNRASLRPGITARKLPSSANRLVSCMNAFVAVLVGRQWGSLPIRTIPSSISIVSAIAQGVAGDGLGAGCGWATRLMRRSSAQRWHPAVV